MKRHVIAIVVGGLFALPALANDEFDAGNLPKDVTPSMTCEQVRAELIAAQRAGDVIVNDELGLTARQAYPSLYAEETGGQLRPELSPTAN
jgi:hypothetical protein